MNNKQKGVIGESIACRYLKTTNTQIIERNYRNRMGEIDIIAKDDKDLIFIEVKSRQSTRYGYPAEAVNGKKIKNITNIAKYYMNAKNIYDTAIRFDVIEIYFKEQKINHIKNAF